jgi:hypothetical protein
LYRQGSLADLRAVAANLLFRPARLHGGPVRVLISQPVDYTFTGRTRG